MKFIASILLSVGWAGIAFTQYELVQIDFWLAELAFKAVAYVITPLALIISMGVYWLGFLSALPKFSIITFTMCLLGLVPLVYFYGDLIYQLIQNAL